LDYQILNETGAFKAWGTGFSYEYEPILQALKVLSAADNKPILSYDLKDDAARHAVDYVMQLDKAIQVHALMYSNNRTTDLTSVVGAEKLPTFFLNSAELALHANYLRLKNFRAFRMNFAQDFSDIKFTIKRVKGTMCSLPFYTSSAHFKNGPEVLARGSRLHKTLFRMSRAITTDLLSDSRIYNAPQQAYSLMKVAGDLNVIGCILDEKFNPNDSILVNPSDMPRENSSI
jgi:hypothetical protein